MAQWMKLSAVLFVLIGVSLLDAQRCPCITGPPDYQCPSAPLMQVYLRHAEYCTRYYKCTDGRAIEFQCPYAMYFDPVAQNCTTDFRVCYRECDCMLFVDACRCCRQQLDNTGLLPQNFYVCYDDGMGLAMTCPLALNPCTNITVQLQFINNKCEVPPTTVTPAPTTTTSASTTTGSTTSTTASTTTSTTSQSSTTTTSSTTQSTTTTTVAG